MPAKVWANRLAAYFDQGQKTKALLLCGALGAPLFIAVFLAEGATRPNYSSLRHPVSSLALGERGWVQKANFTITGLLMLACSSGLRRALRELGGSDWGPDLVRIYAVGLLGAGAFDTDPIGGYPPGAAQEPLSSSTHGMLHNLFSALVFFALPGACLIFSRWFAARGRRGWAVYSASSGVACAAAFFAAIAGFGQARRQAKYGGLFQRLAITIGWSWLALLATDLVRALPDAPRKHEA